MSDNSITISSKDIARAQKSILIADKSRGSRPPKPLHHKLVAKPSVVFKTQLDNESYQTTLIHSRASGVLKKRSAKSFDLFARKSTEGLLAKKSQSTNTLSTVQSNTATNPATEIGVTPIAVPSFATTLFLELKDKKKSCKGTDCKKKQEDVKKKPLSREEKFRLRKKEELDLAKSRTYQLVSYLAKKTHFDQDQVRALIEIHKKIVKKGKMDRLTCREFMHSTLGLCDDVMLDRVFSCFDGDLDGYVSESEFVTGLSVMLRGTLEEQIAYCYEVYDFNGDRAIGRDELRSCLRNCIYHVRGVDLEIELEEASNEIVELALKKLDLDQDGVVKYRDFYRAIHNDPLLLQSIGQCLPTDKCLMTFLSLIATDTRNYSRFLSLPNDPAWEGESDKFNDEKTRKRYRLSKDFDPNMTLVSVFNDERNQRMTKMKKPKMSMYQ